MPNACIFCGTTSLKITREHVWSDWVKKYLPSKPCAMAYAQRSSSKSGTQPPWREPFLESKVRVVCHDCNTHWMSSIDAAAEPIVGPMLTGQVTQLDTAAQQTVAAWAVLKGLVVAQISPRDGWIPQNHYAAVHAARGVPAGTTHVWLARRDNLTDPNAPDRARMCHAHVIPLRDIERPGLTDEWRQYLDGGGALFATSIQLGRFVTLAIHHDWPGMAVRLNLTTPGALSFIPVWPASSEAVRWPPLLPVDDLGNPHLITQFFMMREPVSDDANR